MPTGNTFFHLLSWHHIIKRIIKWAKVWIDFVLQVTRQKPKVFTRFHRWAREHDTVNLSSQHPRNSHRNSQVCFTGTCGAYTEHHLVLLEFSHIISLPWGTGHNYLVSSGDFEMAIVRPTFSSRFRGFLLNWLVNTGNHTKCTVYISHFHIMASLGMLIQFF